MDTPPLKVGTGKIDIEIIGEPEVVPTYKGYAPVVRVKVIKTELPYILYVSAKSLAVALEPLRINNNGKFTGIKISLCKESEDKQSKYVVNAL